MAVWAGLIAIDSAWNAASAACEQARRDGGTPETVGEVPALARFADGDAATAWLLNAFAAWPNALAGALVSEARAGTAVEAAAQILDLMGDARSGEVVLAPGMSAPPRIADPGTESAVSETVRRLRPTPSDEAAVVADDDRPTRISDPNAAGLRDDRAARGAQGADPGEAGADPAATDERPSEEPPEPDGQGQTLKPGNVLSHTYRIEERIGRGGMGTVYLARHVEFGSRHAVKVISPEHGEDDNVTALFRKEAESLRRVRHDAVIAYDGTIRDSAGRLYLIMEYADGPSLNEILRNGPLSEAQAATLAQRIGSGLDAAHDKDIVHRDVSPDNIVLVGDDVAEAKIIDFGIARNLDASAKTVIGSAFAGKYTYASPEQLGLYGGHVDRRSDIYSMGLTLAAVLGKPLAMGETPADAARRREQVPDLAAFPEPWADRLTRMLQPDPNDRPARFAEIPGFAVDTAPPGGAPSPSVAASAGQVGVSAGSTPKQNGRRRALAILGSLACLVVLAVAAGGWLYRDRLPIDLVRPGETDTTATQTANGAESEPSGTDQPPQTAVEAPSGTENAVRDDGTGGQNGSGSKDVGNDEGVSQSGETTGDLPPIEGVRGAVADALPAPDCGYVDIALSATDGGYAVMLSGFVGERARIEELRRDAAATPNVTGAQTDLAVHPPPICTTLEALAPVNGPDAPIVRLDNADGWYAPGERITVEITATAGTARHVYVTHLDSEGVVQHLFPRDRGAENPVASGATLRLGGDDTDVSYTAARPRGNDLLFIISSEQPLFDEPRQRVEAVTDYLDDLRPALREGEAAPAVRTQIIRVEP